MALDESALGSSLKSEIETAIGQAAQDPALLQKMCDAIAKAVVTHIKNNLEASFSVSSGDLTLNPTGLVSPVGPVTGVAQDISGTLEIPTGDFT